MNGNFFIEHPYLSMVIAIVITLCGAIAIFMLPVSQYPNVTPPQVSITASYPGADAQTLLQTVIEPIEEQVNGVEDMIYMSSNASNSGSANITVTFAVGTDGQKNTQNTQSRVNWALSQLPEAVQREGVIVQEQSGNILLAITLDSPDGSYDSLFLSNYAAINIVNELKRIPGTSEVKLFGGSNYAMRFWLNNEKLASLNLSVADVIDAVKSQNMQVSAGALGAAPVPRSEKFHYTVQTLGRLTSPEEFGNIMIRVTEDGAQVRLKDVAKIEMGAETYDVSSTLNNRPSIMILVYQRSSANGIEISKACRATLDRLARQFPPGMACEVKYDSTNFIRMSIRDVVQTLVIAILLVAGVVYLFLQSWRMALVPALAIPVSIVGTFAAMKLLGFSINLVTLFGLILAIGIVVDDAIIVIENVSRLMKEEKLSPREAAEKSMRQISGAIMATTAVLLAMFVPICFLGGITGELYRQFGVTISVAVLLSAINALTLSPSLAAILLKPDETAGNFFLFRRFNSGFAKFGNFYNATIAKAVRFPAAILTVYAFLSLLFIGLYLIMPAGFIPPEDQGVFFANVQLPSNTSHALTDQVAGKATDILNGIPGVKTVMCASGFNVLNMNPAANNAFMLVVLDDWSSRLEKGLPIEKITENARRRLMVLPEAFFMLFEPPPIPGIGMAGGFNFVLEDLSGTNVEELRRYTDIMVGAGFMNPLLRNVFCSWNAATSSVYLEIDREKALQLGVNLNGLYTMLEGSLGFLYINDFNCFGQVYKTEVQSAEQARDTVEKIKRLYVANRQGEMVPLPSLVKIRSRVGPETLGRYNMRLAAQIQGAPAPGLSSKQAMEVMEAIAAKVLPPTMQYEWSEMSYQEQQAGNQAPVVFGLAILFIFLFLAALYGSWLLPLSVIMVIPLVMPGALGLLHLAGISNNIYTQIGLILLFAMACKTAILIVDFAKQQHSENRNAEDAALSAAKLRFRAILMTSLAFIFGTLPLACATGPGAGSQRSIGCSVVGGMSIAVITILFLSPIFYMVCQKLLDKRKKPRN